MKKLLLVAGVAAGMLFTSCTERISTNSKNSVNFPGMTVTRSDYKLSKDVSAEVEVQEWSTFFGNLTGSKTVGEEKNVLRQGLVGNWNWSAYPISTQVAVYRLLEANPTFDYLTNLRVSREYTKEWLLLFTRYNTKIKVTAKGITLNTEK
mgnify:CR=1 FL=1